MLIDSIEARGMQVEQLDIKKQLKELNAELGTVVKPMDGCYQRLNPSVDAKISKMLDIDNTAIVTSLRSTVMDSTKEMLYGEEQNGFKTMGLADVAKWKLDKTSKYYKTNVKQQSGYAAEIVSTYKENLMSKAKGLDVTTYRADDLPELFKKNDQYVDKVRMNSNKEILERIQTKFVGKNGKEWVSKMMSPKFEKYLEGNHVDKLECPKDYYEEIKTTISEKIPKLEQQLERVKADGNNDVAENIQKRIDKLNKIDQMVEQSNTTSKEATFARMHPKCAAAKIFSAETAKLANAEGLKSGAVIAGLTFTVSTVDNVKSYMRGDISAEDMVKDITKETAAAGVLGYGTAFISEAVSQTMKGASSQLIRKTGGSCLPANVVSFAIESYDSISDFAQGKIDGSELAYDLGENATSITGATIGAKVGGVLGTAVGGPVGCAAGSIVGGMIGCAVTSEAYATAVDKGVDTAEMVSKKAGDFAQNTIDTIKDIAPEKVSDVANVFNNFISDNKLPITIHI